jgi:hypothetical protein
MTDAEKPFELSTEIAQAHDKLPVDLSQMTMPLDMQVRSVALTLAQRHCGAEVSLALQRLGAGPDLLSVIGSWMDATLSEREVLAQMKRYNESGKAMRPMVTRRRCRLDEEDDFD